MPTETILLPTSDPLAGGLPKIAGHQVTYPELRAFQTWTLAVLEGQANGAVKRAAEVAGVDKSTIRMWRRSEWWSTMWKWHVSETQQDFHAQLIDLHEDGVRALRKVFRGELDEVTIKSANAIVNGIGLLTKIGEKPLQDTRTSINVDARTVNNSGTINLVKDQVKDMGQDDLLKVITGQMHLPE